MSEWSVAVSGVARATLDVDSDDVFDFSEAIAKYSPALSEPAISTDGRRFTVRLAVDEDTIDDAINTAVVAVYEYAEKFGLPLGAPTQIEALEWSEFERLLKQPTFPDVVGVAEIAELLGLSRQRASAVARTAQFPRPHAELASGPVWLEPNVRRFVDEWERKPGRPRKARSASS